MKIFQIINDLCAYDATRKHSTLESTIGKYPPDVLFVEAPDYVFEGWGYNKMQEGDARFIQPEAPDGWLYDKTTGTFYEKGDIPPIISPTLDERVSAIETAISDGLKLYEEDLSNA